MFTINWQPRALRQLLKIRPGKQREAISASVGQLADFPNCQNVKALKNQEHRYRLRVGRYRVLFAVETSVRVISVEQVRKRDERTYD
jgi:mRNA interferase RelE/StbE